MFYRSNDFAVSLLVYISCLSCDLGNVHLFDITIRIGCLGFRDTHSESVNSRCTNSYLSTFLVRMRVRFAFLLFVISGGQKDQRSSRIEAELWLTSSFRLTLIPKNGLSEAAFDKLLIDRHVFFSFSSGSMRKPRMYSPDWNGEWDYSLAWFHVRSRFEWDCPFLLEA